ncbi:FadR/GntR family transcriptional regulator [Kribbella solani]|uniref:GntR family transcriptional repressor for pyruvate dehydrogenase complex n=1 Tax=Kribbella solani TaxID=236067 RepID=A0A841DIM7_9ACTN|nr:FCD domain-containing protein [Kribbella solani]MBB5977399.1 GntR family transcriptional repressor for pyruvate dehydrogenase complex [Kribbella solani]
MIDPSAVQRRDSQASRIARALVDRVKDGSYPIGQKIPSERQLATEFGVSRPVIREALSTVSAMDILDIQMGRGAYVTAAPAEHIAGGGLKLQDVVNVREVLEVGAIELTLKNPEPALDGVRAAAERLQQAVRDREDTVEPDRALHAAIVQAAGSSLLASIWQTIDQQVVETIRISPHGRTMSQDILDLHQRLADSIINGDLEAAVESSRLLYEDNRQFLRELLQ